MNIIRTSFDLVVAGHNRSKDGCIEVRLALNDIINLLKSHITRFYPDKYDEENLQYIPARVDYVGDPPYLRESERKGKCYNAAVLG